jgi:beta-glucosidase
VSGGFPFADRPRLWGTAVSHYQVEGGDDCDWTDWERRGLTRGEPCGDAARSWELYEHDADLARAAGANAFRFSISWSRVEPRPGRFDRDALSRYRRFVNHLHAIGLEPVVTLFHYTHPPWFHAESPWTSTAAIDRFRRFTSHVCDFIGDRVRMWIPLNEPLVFVLAGYYDAQIPPGLAEPRLVARVLDHLLAAHVESAAVIREANPEAAIGVAHNMMAFAPRRRFHPLDRTLARMADRCYNRGLVEAFATGRWSFLLPPATRVSGRRDELPKSIDFFGVNFYSRLHLRCPGTQRAIGDFEYLDANGGGLTDNGWEIVPDALEPLLREASRSGLPLVVSENGIADADDRNRARFIDDHLAAIVRSRVPVHGYFHWSLVDNYEWLDGFGPKFGLYAVDRATMQRSPRASVEAFHSAGARFLASR